ncbi:cytoplasmic dynein 2 heavy chain 1-like [Ornithodoros turicata]|uniref:cytoplasmic dynein 2 heavy chain 1-like n=1 Tax=Ornithodoros turicata TaxID=34597 RepID=UPI003139B60B
MVNELLDHDVEKTSDWHWQKQLRFYLSKGTAVVRMVDAQFEYTYEYQGNAPKLVRTPLTDRCFVTLTQGMRMGVGGNPYGPAGTGKTESVKALGNALGRQVLVFNCDEGIDVKSMGRIFLGLVRCGAWGCFDEFNRLEESVLSAVSAQIQQIQTSLGNRARDVQLLGQQVEMDCNAGIFITLNPAGKGYGGRQKLPDNLKQLFRPVAMCRPDDSVIARVLLFAEGFKCSDIIGPKLVALFRLARELLTHKQHYDWGLRALKSVLQASGKLLKSARASQAVTVQDEKTETTLAVQALRLNTLPKLSHRDRQQFDALIKDVIPDIEFTEFEDADLIKAVKEACEELKLIENQTQIRKVLELHEQLKQRMGVVVVGPSGAGKTTLWKLLLNALKRLGHSIQTHIFNPKAMPRQQLLGYIDIDTREWHDGVLTASARAVVREPPGVLSWVVCDGDIDPEWIESLNSVLDDNRLLTMPSGERIQFGPHVNFIFETHDLSCASPATVSRMGMIFLSIENIEVTALVASWLHGQPQHAQSFFRQLLDDYFYKALEWVMKCNDFSVDTTAAAVVKSGLVYLSEAIKTKQEFAMALVRGFAANLNKASKEKLAKEVLSRAKLAIPDSNHAIDTYYDKRRDRLDKYSPQGAQEVSLASLACCPAPIVETGCVLRMVDFLLPLLSFGTRPVLIVGPEGCGKSVLVQHCLQKVRSVQTTVVHCSAQTSPTHIVQKLTECCVAVTTSRGRCLRPKETEKLVLHLRDINLPKPDKWGTCQLVAWLQQVVNYEGFYDQDLVWVNLEGIQIVCSLSLGNSIGRHQLSTRFTSVVQVVSLDYPEREQLVSICSAYLRPALTHLAGKKSDWSSPDKAERLASSMLLLLEQVQTKFTVDDRNHYVFTPKILTQWVFGLLRYTLESGTSPLEPWAYECCRLFRDQLSDHDSRARFDAILTGIIRADWSGDLNLEFLKDSFYITRMGDKVSELGRPLDKIRNTDWETSVRKTLNMYVQEVRQVPDAVLYPELLELVAYVDRVLSLPGGSVLLAGTAGTGRRLAAGLVAHMHGMTTFTPKMTQDYGVRNFKAELRTILQCAGIDGQPTVLLIEDHHILVPEITEMLNGLLAAGEVPGLFASEELEPLLSSIRNQAAEEDFRGHIFNYFCHRVRRNLHMVLIFDCRDASFARTCESNPSFYKRCSVMWLSSWSKDTMEHIPKVILREHGGSDTVSKETCLASAPLSYFLKIHNSCSDLVATSPHRYSCLVRTYSDVYCTKMSRIEKRRDHLKAGISKLNEAKNNVDKLKAEAAKQKQLLDEKQAEADDALQQITMSMTSTSDQKSEMEALKARMEEENKKLSKRKKEIDQELAEIEPLIQEAKAAVGNIKSDSLSEIRSLRAPPDVIRDILEGVLRLMGIFDTSWVSMKSFLAKRGVKEEITNFDAHSITPEIARSVHELLKKHHASFDQKNAKRASAAAAPLAAWVKANVMYAEVLQKIQPLESEQAKLKLNLSNAERRMNRLGTALEDVDQEVARLRDKLNKFTKEAAEIEIHLRGANETIATAEDMVQQLDGEYHRWTRQLAEMEEELKELPLRCLAASAFLTYLSGCSEDVRAAALTLWCKVLGLPIFVPSAFLGTEKQQLTWKTEGLPADPLSLENAIIILQTSLCPFLVDPSGQATVWLERHLRDSHLEVVTQHDANFVTVLELAVRFGKALLIKEVDRIEPILYPLLRKELISQGPRNSIQIGERTVDYNDDFKLFLATRNPYVNLPNYAASVVTIVNFTTTRAGLSEQLLQAVLQHEKPELEQRRSELLRKEEELQLQVVQLEDSLLEQLVSAHGNLLANKPLLASLQRTKASSLGIEASLKESHQLQAALDEERQAYLPLASFGSSLHFLISELPKLNSMYVFSLPSFLNLFKMALKQTSSEHKQEKRLEEILKCFQRLVYENVSRGLLKSDRLAFALHIVHGMYPELFKENEWEAFTGMLLTDLKFDKDSIRSELPGWLEDERALAVAVLKNLFPDMWAPLRLEKEDMWRGFAESSHCEQEIPGHVARMLSPFQQVLLVQALRPDRLISALTFFVTRVLGLKEISPPALNLQRLHASETCATEPVLMITSPGADPSQEIREVAARVVGVDRYHQISMGQGQMDAALELLKTGAREGSWVCFTNLHLVSSWLPLLVKELCTLKPHQDFRLWLTTEGHPNFSNVLIQMCLKVTYEAPPGIKRNLQRTYDGWTPDFVSAGGNLLCSQSFFALAWFHAVVQERRTFIPQGWTKFYEFGMADLKAGADIISRHCLKERQTVEWRFLRGLFETAVYGGRVDNAFDMEVLASYLRQYFDSSVISGTPGSRCRVAPSVSVPSEADHREHLKVTQLIADEDSPSYFGLPSNIDRSAQRTRSADVIWQLKQLMRPGDKSEGFDAAKWSTLLSPVLNLWKKLNQGSQLIHKQVTPPSNSSRIGGPIDNFLQMEYYNGIRLVQEIHASLAALSKVIRGTALVTREVRDVGTSLMNHKVPSKWETLWEGPDDSLQYLRAVVSRALAVQTWVQRSEAGLLLQDHLDLAELFRPDTFLNALRQHSARVTHHPMDSLQFVTSWKGRISKATVSITLDGLQLEGCRFDGRHLTECRHNSPSISSIPSCTAAWLPKGYEVPYSDVINVPLYTSTKREKVITTLSLPCNGDQDLWLRCGVALFLRHP